MKNSTMKIQLKFGLIIMVIAAIVGLVNEACAQVTLPMRTSKINDVKHILNELAMKGDTQYQIIKADTAVKAWKQMFIQLANSDTTKVMRVTFFKGEDGVPFYEFNQVTGSYMDLFPFWKKYIEPEADIEAAQKKQSVVLWKVGDKQKRLVFFKSGSEWVITVRS